MSILDEFRTRNFSVYGQWMGVLCIILCIALGIANIFNFSLVIIFSIICLVFGVILIFVEVPILLKICPTSAKFDGFLARFANNWPRAGLYIGMAVVQYCSIILRTTSLIAAAVFLTLAGLCYAFAGITHQEFTGSRALGGAGVAQMIV